jgi:hypothetical protein
MFVHTHHTVQTTGHFYLLRLTVIILNLQHCNFMIINFIYLEFQYLNHFKKADTIPGLSVGLVTALF